MTEITRLEGELSRLEGNLRAKERAYHSAKGNYSLGWLVGMLFATAQVCVAPPLGIFLIVVSALATALAQFKASGAQRAAKAQLSATEEKITQTRSKLAELRVELISM